MQNKDLISMLTFYAISPIHAGSGAATSVVDLPIQRERHTNWPHIQASAVKGALRAHYRNFAGESHLDEINMIFGSDKGNDGKQKGAEETIPGVIAVSDAKLLAFPVRSNIAPFVWVTSPAQLKRFAQDMKFMGKDIKPDLPAFAKEDDAYVLRGEFTGKVLLEDGVVEVKGPKTNLWSGFPEIEKLLLISDSMYDYVVTSCTEVQTQIKIEAKTGTTQDGSLRYQELLPADSLLYSVVYFSAQSFNEFQAKTVQDHVQSVVKDFMQIGGDETLGRGICKINWL